MATKHHNTRFAGQDKKLQIGKSKNLPAGTVFDREVVSVDKFDFYLMSSQGIQGTSIPTHYHVLHDDNELTADSAEVHFTSRPRACKIFGTRKLTIFNTNSFFYVSADILCRRDRETIFSV